MLSTDAVDRDLQEGADLVVRYGKKIKGEEAGANVLVEKVENDANQIIKMLSFGVQEEIGE